MTRQTWTAFVAAFVFVGLSVLLVVIPVPFVSWSPGSTTDTLGDGGKEPIIKVAGIPTYPTTGKLDLTVVSVTSADAPLTLPQALLSYWLPNRDTLPRDAVYAPDKSAAEVEQAEAVQMETAQDEAVVAALRADHQPVTEMPVVFSVTVGGPAHRILMPGDLIVSVDGTPTPDINAVGEAIRKHRVGQKVNFVVIRAKTETSVSVRAAESPAQADTPVLGIELAKGYQYAPHISVDIGQRIGGPSAGLVFALAIYDKITDGPLLQGRHIAGTGTITPAGNVGAIGGIQEKIAGAEKAGATAFLVPSGNCADLAGVRTDLTLIKVSTLDDAISSLEKLTTSSNLGELPHC